MVHYVIIKVSNLIIDIVCDSLPDCVVFELRNSTALFIACYIPPKNSAYYSDAYFDNLLMACESFVPRRDVFILGDLNSRVGNAFPKKGFSYIPNPDSDLNQHGRKLTKLLLDIRSLVIVNGVSIKDRMMDSKLTFFRGRVSSQNDMVLANNVNMIHSFEIKNKLPVSDHCPCMLTLERRLSPDMSLINDCANGFQSYSHYDINKRINPAVNIKKLNLSQLNTELMALGRKVKDQFQHLERSEESVNNLCTAITDGIYDVCCKSRIKQHPLQRTPTHENCNSKNFKAISEAKYMCYIYYSNNDTSRSEQYRDEWLLYQAKAWQAENDELAKLKSKQWRHCYTNDPKKLWRMIDWKGEITTDKSHDDIPPNVIHTYFNNIFNSEKTMNDPTLDGINIDEIVADCPVLDPQIDKDELDYAIKKIGNGVSFDGLSSDVLTFLPEEIRECMLKLFQNIFVGPYPNEWSKQLLKAVTKKGHSIKQPKLRGIGIGPIIGRLYDIIINGRFRSWYEPNPEQAGFRKHQGCVLQIFGLFLLLDWAKYRGHELFIGLLDYEKAFDFVNRNRLINDMVAKGADKNLVRNIYNMYKETSYIPQIDRNRMGEEIPTNYGVTQGKNSSCDIFSFYTSDMPECFEQQNQLVGDAALLQLVNLLQLADDTVTGALTLPSLSDNFKRIFDYSDDKHSKVNYDKTQYMPLCTNSVGEEHLRVREDISIAPVDPSEGYPWLGFHLSYADSIPELITYNVEKKKFNTVKFYAWLQINRDTPFMLKMRVLYGCMFAAILYSCEAWGDVRHLGEMLLAIERKALKSCLGVKQSTPNSILFVELNKGDIMSVISHRQYSFYQRFLELDDDDSIAKQIWRAYTNDQSFPNRPKPLLDHYNSLTEHHMEQNMISYRETLLTSEKSMDIRYRTLIPLTYNKILYSSLTNDDARMIVTRWRLSCHKLHVETGRYKTPKVERQQRVCKMCGVLEDEQHALFVCDAHYGVRIKFRDKINWTSVSDMLNPENEEDLITIAAYIKAIETNMDALMMIQ